MIASHMSRLKLLRFLYASLLVAAFSIVASAGELRIFSTIDVQPAMEELAPKFEAMTGDRLQFTWGTSVILSREVLRSQGTPDLMILVSQSLGKLIADGKVIARSRVDLASSVIAAVVKKGAPKPDISTPDAFRQTLLNARAISFSNPAAGGASGVHVAGLLKRLGIAAQLQNRIRYPPPGGNSALLVASGEVELAIQQEPEVITAPGVDLVGPLPSELNRVTTVSAGIAVESQKRQSAAKLIKFLQTPEATAIFKARGLTPIEASS